MDGKPIALAAGKAAHYYRRDVRAPKGGTAALGVTGAEQVKVWVNGEVAFDKKLQRPRRGRPTPEPISLPLKEGANDLLVKVSSAGGRMAAVTFATAWEGQTLASVDVDAGGGRTSCSRGPKT